MFSIWLLSASQFGFLPMDSGLLLLLTQPGMRLIGFGGTRRYAAKGWLHHLG